MELLGIEELTAAVDGIIWDIVGMDANSNLSTDFGAYCDMNEIDFAVVVLERMDSMFSQFVKETFDVTIEDTIDLWCLSLLHELGHLQTMDFIPNYIQLANKLEKKVIDKFSKIDSICYKYFSLTVEYEATQWACNWIKDNPTKYDEMRNTIAKALEDFYKINNVED